MISALRRLWDWFANLPPLDGDGCEAEPYDTHRAVQD